MADDDKLKGFYEALKSGGTVEGLPNDYGSFQKGLSNPKNAEGFFNQLKSSGAVEGLPNDFGTFSTSLGLGKQQPPSSPAVGGGSKLVGGAGVRSITLPSVGGGVDFGFGGVVEKIGKPQQQPEPPVAQPSEPSFGFENVVEQVGKPTITSEEIKVSTQKEKAAKAEEEPSVVSDVFDSFLRGSARLGQSLAETPAFIYDLAAKPQNYIADKFNLPGLKASSDQLGKMIGVEDNVIADYYKGLVEESQAKFQQKYDKGITDYIANDEYGKAFSMLANQIAESAPITISLAMGNAAGIGTAGSITGGGLVFGAQKKSELDKEAPWMSESDKLDAALMNGLAEGVFEQFGLTKIGSVVKNVLAKSGKEAAKEIAEKGFKEVYGKVFRQYFGTTMEEGLSEAATTFAQNAIDKYSGAKPNINLWDNVSDSFIVGLGSGGVIGGVPVALQVAQTKKGLAEQEKINQQKAQLNDALVSDQIPDEAKRVLVDKVKDLNEQEANILLQETNIYNSLDAENKGKVDALSSDEDGIKTALADENLQPEVKSVLEEKLSEIGKQKDEILGTTPTPTQNGKEQTKENVEPVSEGAQGAELRTEEEEEVGQFPRITFESAIAVPENDFVYNGEKGKLVQDGQTISFETDNRIYELGNVDELSSKGIDELGIEQLSAIDVVLNDDNSLVIEGEKFVNNFSNPNAAINYDSDGNVQSVNLETEDGQKRTFRGQRAEEIAYQYKLKSLEQNGTDEQIDTAIEQAEQAVEAERVADETAPKRKGKSARQRRKEKRLKSAQLQAAKEGSQEETAQQPTKTNQDESTKEKAGIQEGGTQGNENVPENVQGNGKERGQEVNVQNEGELLTSKTKQDESTKQGGTTTPPTSERVTGSEGEAQGQPEKQPTAQNAEAANGKTGVPGQENELAPVPPTAQSVSIFQELDKVPSQSKGKRAKAERAKFDNKHGEKAKQAKDINANFEAYEKKLMDEGVILKKKC